MKIDGSKVLHFFSLFVVSGSRFLKNYNAHKNFPMVPQEVACVKGVIGEGEGKVGKQEKIRGIFSRLPLSLPPPFVITPATKATQEESGLIYPLTPCSSFIFSITRL